MNFHRSKREKGFQDDRTASPSAPADSVDTISGPVNGPINVDLLYPKVPQVEDSQISKTEEPDVVESEQQRNDPPVQQQAPPAQYQQNPQVQHQQQQIPQPQYQQNIPQYQQVQPSQNQVQYQQPQQPKSPTQPPSMQQHQQFQQSVPPPPPPPAQYLQHRYEYRDEPTSPTSTEPKGVYQHYSEMPLPPLPPGPPPPPPTPPQYVNAPLPPPPGEPQQQQRQQARQSPTTVSPKSTPMSSITPPGSTPPYQQQQQQQVRSPPAMAPPPVPPAGSSESREEKTPTGTPSIPPSVKADDISMMSYLDLSSNNSTATMISSTGRLPRWLQKVTGLQYLVCKNLGLSVVDEWVSTKLINLRVMRLNDNKIATWPDHLARLAPFGNLQVLDLEGNPCLENMFIKSPSFRALYYEGGNPNLSSSVIRKHKKISDESAAAFKKLQPSSSSGGGLFRKKKKEKQPPVVIPPEVDSSEDDMLSSLEPTTNPTLLKKKTSFGFGMKNGASTSGSNSPNTPVPSVQDRNSMSSNPDRWAHQKIELSEANKSKVVLQLLVDIYELANRIPIEPKDPATRNSYNHHHEDDDEVFEDLDTANPAHQQQLAAASRRAAAKSVSAQGAGHNRVNSVDVLQHYLEVNDQEYESSDVLQQEMSGLSMDNSQPANVAKNLEEFLIEERKFVQRMHEFQTIYCATDGKISNKAIRKAQPCFKFIPDIAQLHSETLLGLIEAALERLRQNNGEEEDTVLEMLGSRIVSLSDEFHWYLEYALVIEEAKRKINTWIKIRKVDSSPYSYGTALPGYTPTQQHPDNDVAEWLRSCLKHKEHSLSTCSQYMDLPFQQVEKYRNFFAKFSYAAPSMVTAYHNFNSLVGEIAERRPMAERRRRLQELQKIFRMKDIYGHYICDLSVALQSRLIIEDASPNRKDLKIADTIYREDGQGEPQAKSVSKIVYDYARPTSGTLMRIIVFENTVVVCDDGKRQILKQIDKRLVTADVPVLLPSAESIAASSENGSDHTKTTSSSSSSEANSVHKNMVRVAFWEEMCVWYAMIRSNRGGDRNAFVKCF